MIAQKNDKQRRLLIFGLLILVAAALFVLNYPHLLIETVPLWYRIVEPALLVIGLVGSVLMSKPLRVAGWIAICLFLPVLLAATPDLDHADPEFRGFSTLWRVALTLALWVSLAVCFRKLAVKSRQPTVSRNTP